MFAFLFSFYVLFKTKISFKRKGVPVRVLRAKSFQKQRRGNSWFLSFSFPLCLLVSTQQAADGRFPNARQPVLPRFHQWRSVGRFRQWHQVRTTVVSSISPPGNRSFPPVVPARPEQWLHSGVPFLSVCSPVHVPCLLAVRRWHQFSTGSPAYAHLNSSSAPPWRYFFTLCLLICPLWMSKHPL